MPGGSFFASLGAAGEAGDAGGVGGVTDGLDGLDGPLDGADVDACVVCPVFSDGDDGVLVGAEFVDVVLDGELAPPAVAFALAVQPVPRSAVEPTTARTPRSFLLCMVFPSPALGSEEPASVRTRTQSIGRDRWSLETQCARPLRRPTARHGRRLAISVACGDAHAPCSHAENSCADVREK